MTHTSFSGPRHSRAKFGFTLDVATRRWFVWAGWRRWTLLTAATTVPPCMDDRGFGLWKQPTQRSCERKAWQETSGRVGVQPNSVEPRADQTTHPVSTRSDDRSVGPALHADRVEPATPQGVVIQGHRSQPKTGLWIGLLCWANVPGRPHHLCWTPDAEFRMDMKPAVYKCDPAPPSLCPTAAHSLPSKAQLFHHSLPQTSRNVFRP